MQKRIHKNQEKTFRKIIENSKIKNYVRLSNWGIGAKIYQVEKIDDTYSYIDTYAGKTFSQLSCRQLPKNWK